MSRSPVTAGGGLTHEAALFRSDDEMLDMTASFLRDGLAAGEAGLVAVADDVAASLRRELSDAPIVFFPAPRSAGNPTAAIAGYREALAAQRDAGAARVRIVGEVPHPGRPGAAAPAGAGTSFDGGLGAPHPSAWDWWSRYEAASGHILGDFDAWSMCPYDLRTTPSDVVDDVLATHPYLSDGRSRHRRNPDVLPAEEFLARPRPPAGHPLEDGPAHQDLLDPTPAAARTAARYLTAHLPPHRVEAFVFGLSEAVSNAFLHGVPPVRVRLWSGRGHAVAAVTDTGPGPSSPFAGLLPDPTALSGGLGLWTTMQVCPYVTFEHSPEGFTLRVATG
ncbi:MEDS domain-containing protein [Pseudonocardia sp. KRD291]|uniref:MEDS domain-containing protein n=1 Tax=Pseudonocardia sp. KRD291 TaxID=2792007 RepID=UPI001C4A710E|nr:MEDS domain-containing protein [Pseudonocardia sp. KRD291]MBW0101329.1 MEDS domain-containing protein [Pseudonocardia sp. KRD291]